MIDDNIEFLNLITDQVRPNAQYKCGDAIISLYRAKNIYSKRWNDPGLRKVTLICRETFLRYGNRALTDRYDSKAGVYLARASYAIPGNDGKIQIVNEWLSSRLVPGDRKPLGCGELELYKYGGKRLDKILEESVFKEEPNFWKNIVSGSRICGIGPYSTTALPLNNRYSAACFALIYHHFSWECDAKHIILSGIIQNSFIESRLSVTDETGRKFVPFLTPAYEYMGLEKENIKSERDIYSYKFPSYWLNMAQLLRLIERLIQEGELTERTIKFYLKTELSFKNIVSNKEFQRLGELLSVRGNIKWSNMTGSQLRKLIDANVEDLPELKITDMKAWNKSIRYIISALQIELI